MYNKLQVLIIFLPSVGIVVMVAVLLVFVAAAVSFSSVGAATEREERV